MRRLSLVLLLIASACSPPSQGLTDSGVADAGATDAGDADAGAFDAGATDAGDDDAGAFDAGATDAGDADAGAFDAGATDAGDLDAGPPLCTPGMSVCQGNDLITCNSDGSGYLLPQDCGQTATCLDGGCAQHVCTPSSKTCLNGEVVTCDPDGLSSTSEDCPANTHCEDAGDCVDDVCIPDSYGCVGTLRQQCNADGTGWINVETCTYACTGGACGGTCTPGMYACSGASPGSTRQQCDATGTWQDTSTCVHGCDLATNDCYASCFPGELRCSGGTGRQLCNDAGTNWNATYNCPYACTGAGQCTGECANGSRRCSAGKSQTCSNNTWTNDSSQALNASGCTNYAVDSDNDGYGSGATVCACAPYGQYTLPVSFVAQQDCCDTDSSAHPGSTVWSAQQDACGSWDRNCDGATQHYYPADQKADNCQHVAGWDNGDPSLCGYGSDTCECGEQGRWISAWSICTPTAQSIVYQTCQ